MLRHGTPLGDRRFRKAFVSSLLLGATLNPINASTIATATVPIARSFHVSPGRATILISALYIAGAAAQPVTGRLAEQCGPRRVSIAGLILIMIAGAVGAAAPNFTTVLLSRVMIGIGTSTAYPAAMVVIRRDAEAQRLPSAPGRLLGWLAIAGQATVAVGLPLGGLLVGLFGWRSTFAVNLPLAGTALVLTMAGLPRDHVVRPDSTARNLRRLLAEVDALGIALFCATIVALIRALTSIPATNLTAMIVALSAACLLVAVELRVATPFFDIRALRRHRSLTVTYLRTAGTMFGFYAVMYGMTQWLQEVRSLPALDAGAVVLPLTGAAVLVSIPAARRGSVRRPLIVAAAAATLACTGLALVTARTPVWLLLLLLTGFGVTLGYGTVGNQATLYCQAPRHMLGAAAGLQRTFTYLSAILSASIVGLIYQRGVTVHGLHLTALILLGLSAVVLAVTLVDRSIPNSLMPPDRQKQALDYPASSDQTDQRDDNHGLEGP